MLPLILRFLFNIMLTLDGICISWHEKLFCPTQGTAEVRVDQRAGTAELRVDQRAGTAEVRVDQRAGTAEVRVDQSAEFQLLSLSCHVRLM